MARGPGKYDDEATLVRRRTAAKAVVVIVVAGTRGSGFSVQAEEGVVLPLPTLLRQIADDMERESGE